MRTKSLFSVCPKKIWKRPTHKWKDVQSTSLVTATAAAKSLQLCLTLCDPTDGSPPGSPVPGILQARTLEWAAISFSNAWKRKVKVKSLSRIWLLRTPGTVAHQAPPLLVTREIQNKTKRGNISYPWGWLIIFKNFLMKNNNYWNWCGETGIDVVKMEPLCIRAL